MVSKKSSLPILFEKIFAFKIFLEGAQCGCFLQPNVSDRVIESYELTLTVPISQTAITEGGLIWGRGRWR